MIKVLIVSPSFPFPEYKDGLSKINYNLLIGNKKYNTDLLCIADTRLIPLKSIKIYSIPKKENINKAYFFLKWLFTNMPFNIVKYEAYFEEMAKKIESIHRNYDIIHISSYFFAPLINIISKGIHRKIILFPIDSLSLFMDRRSKSECNLIRKIAYKFDFIKSKIFEAKYYKLYDNVFFVSEIDAHYVRSLDESIKTGFIPNGVDINYFKKKEHYAIQKNSLIFTGDMSYSPNEDAALFLIEEVYPIIKKYIDIKIYIVGQKPTKKIINYSSNNIIVTGFVADIRPYLESASIYISPLRFGSGIKNKILEAMSMSKIVIGTRVSFEGINIDDGLNAVSINNNALSIANVVIKILNNFSQYNNIGIAARRLMVEKYSWEQVLLQYGTLYENSIGNR
ncbi:glycosyltransferase [Campylobacter curvus]|uniref:glycosyltransferase n=1 Tax=Campylobacter curvus TaxID=200 RepID=UPI0014705D77|nr:glycosyltransferase [Campylobacter curvus]